MFLSKLEIFGFKSFANRTVINFNRGITGIVGPNGCGKTNIVDAIRWVLGEQKTTTLRSDKMENVIFNGTRFKKPMGMSEVSLTLVNDKGILPTEYSEVTITRRIFRSGESEYLLNKNICRLKDITNLFMDTGIGTNAYSVIELKMIETILSSKAEERRRLFEEAAGVNKYKLRRRLSLKKLDDVKADLTRVNDIVSEVEKSVRSLERQAKRANQYTQIQSILRDKELDLAEHEFALNYDKKNKLHSEVESYKIQKDEIDKKIREIENQLIDYRDKINEVDNVLQKKRKEISEITDSIHNNQKSLSVSQERLNSLSSNHDRLINEIEEFRNLIEDTEFAREEAQQKLRNIEMELENGTIDLQSTEKTIEAKRAELESKRKELRELQEKRFAILREISDKENYLSALNKELNSHSSSLERLNTKIQDITNKIAKTVGFIEELNNEKSEAEKKLNEAGLELTIRQKEKADLEAELNLLKESEIEKKTLLVSLKEKIDFIQTLITNLEGLSNGSKVLIENDEWTGKEKLIFADVGNTKEEFRFALEAALKSVLNNLLIESTDELVKAVDYLKKNQLGKASFYLLKNNQTKTSIIGKLTSFSQRRRAKKIEREEGFLGWATQFVETDKKWEPYFIQILKNIGIVKDLNTCLRLHSLFPDFGLATLEGDLILPNGIIVAGSLPKEDETLFGRRKLLENLRAQLPSHEKELQEIKMSIEKVETQISEIDLKHLSERERLISNDLLNIDKQISQLEFEKKKANEEIENSQYEITELAEKSNMLQSQISEINVVLEELYNKKEKIDSEISEFETNLKKLEDSYNSLIKSFNDRKLDLERLRGEINNIKSVIERYENDIINSTKGIEKREASIKNNEFETEELKIRIEDLISELNLLEGERNAIREEETKIAEELRKIKDEASSYENQLRDLRNRRQEISDAIHSFDIKESEINYKMDTLKEHIHENYNVELELKEFQDLQEFNFEEISKEVHDLKEKLKNLGPVNLLAYSEYEEEKKRLDFLLKQRDDLIESEKDLVNTINEINETAQNLFIDTFEKIRENFIKIFQTLFNPGDEADLKLEEGIDPLEAKIEIMAKPKGKRPTSIELLSGGEKTLTATALLFAIYLVKPSPFCILDEVDAPLDDANVDRFTKLLKEFSKDTQFIIVTHNKRTMEAAETMYGVTMQEEGISKLVGVRFEEIPETQN